MLIFDLKRFFYLIKIVTIIFKDSKRPLLVSIKNGKVCERENVVCISPESPLAQAIVNHSLGEKIQFNTPEGRLEVKITRISD